jgi:hypothetical protein
VEDARALGRLLLLAFEPRACQPAVINCFKLFLSLKRLIATRFIAVLPCSAWLFLCCGRIGRARAALARPTHPPQRQVHTTGICCQRHRRSSRRPAFLANPRGGQRLLQLQTAAFVKLCQPAPRPASLKELKSLSATVGPLLMMMG